MKNKISTRTLTMCAMFTALTAVCSQIVIPLPSMVPISLSLLAVHLSGALLGVFGATLSQIVYILLGAVGAPVFAQLRGGLGVLAGLTGGYIIGYVLCAFTVGILAQKWGRSFWKLVLGMALGTALCYAFGTAWFIVLTGKGLAAALLACVLPFLPGDAIKIALAAFLAVKLYPRLPK
ncbi:MAG: biotin transporter BioY [Hydrogenoanaerobacterium sp.]